MLQNDLRRDLCLLFLGLCFYGFFLARPVAADLEIAGVRFPATVMLEDAQLILNGVGERRLSFLGFGITAYAIALYVEEQSTSIATIAKQKRKRVIIQFTRSVDVDRLRSGWIESLQENISDISPIEKEIDQFSKAMVTVNKGDQTTFDMNQGTVTLSLNGKIATSVQSSVFEQAVLLIWLGQNPPNEEMKAGLLMGRSVAKKD